MSSVDTSESKKASLTTLVKTFSVAVASCPANTCFVAFDCLFVCAIDLLCAMCDAIVGVGSNCYLSI